MFTQGVPLPAVYYLSNVFLWDKEWVSGWALMASPSNLHIASKLLLLPNVGFLNCTKMCYTTCIQIQVKQGCADPTISHIRSLKIHITLCETAKASCK